ncbi:tyrosine-protein kinase CSK-like [Acanthaster planci]|uniref:Tyrosine-protein kinase n=1 Tax=Acanthaster planci TaxID=133434 RepID=A0A8B7ZCA8_ACAPL|nr:tyrosine-protein kinase CSK-like [Acanthaster planci]
MSGKSWVTRWNDIPQKDVVKLDDKPWFHGKITREEAEKLLDPWKTGTFLVRESTHYPGDYTLCVCDDARVEHYRVMRNQNKMTIDEEIFFNTLPELVAHYTEDSDGLVSRLITPIVKIGCDGSEQFKKAGWCIDRRLIKPGRVIGKGNFGEVRRGEYLGKDVAIKVTRGDKIEAQSFLAEASIMTQLRHGNLVQLIGVSPGDSLWIVLEFMSKGNLLDYLRSRGRTVIRQLDQINFSIHIACGMRYLEEKKFVHRDLAARNILVSDEDIAKVSDFGLAQHDKDVAEKSKIPVKWTAPEAVREKKYSTKSDVWSYGILLWELYSFGRVPYPRVPADNVILFVEEGNRMQPPDDCPENIYDVMVNCWKLRPEKRPRFADIENRLKDLRQQLIDEQKRMETTS